MRRKEFVRGDRTGDGVVLACGACGGLSERLRPSLVRAAAASMLLQLLALSTAAWGQAGGGGTGWAAAVEAGAAKPEKPAPQKRRARAQPAEAAIKATAAEVHEAGNRTVFHLQLTAPPGVNVYTLAHPHRVVIDLAGVAFQLPPSAGRQGKGDVSAFRFGLMAAGQSRIMLDLARPVRVETAELTPHGQTHRLEIRLAATDEATFVREASQPLPDAAPALSLDTLHEEAPAVPGSGKARSRPVVVLDPGHGGVDPGAVGVTDVTEKALVLAVAKQVKALLPPSRYNVVMTRVNDVYVGLDARLEVSRQMEADLFVSIHADAIDGRFAQSVRGATIYTLSEKASDDQAHRLAEKENAADAVAGLASVPQAERDSVKGILIDLMKRETANFSSDFSRLLVGRLGSALSLAKDPQRSAAFKVLRQTQSPSVLIELGYMTNAEDERQMRTPEWQRKVAQAIATSIEAYFAKRTAGTP